MQTIDEQKRMNYARAADFLRRLRKNAHFLKSQEFKTLKGQAVAGDVNGAELGLQKILRRCGV